MANNRMWFGTRKHMQWVKCPNSGLGMNRVGWGANGTYLNGGGWSRRSATTHFEPSLTWSFLNSAEARRIQDYYLGVYGPGPILWLDPFAAITNALPLHWSVPSLAANDAPPLIRGRRPTLSDTGPNNNDLPSEMATYEFKSGDEYETAYVPCPPGHRVHFAAWGSGSGGLYLSRDAAPGQTLVRTNIALNASPSSGGSYVWATGGNGSTATPTLRTTGDGPAIKPGQYARRTIGTASPTGTWGPYAYANAPADIVAGSVWTVSVYVRPSFTTSMQMSLTCRDASGAMIGVQDNGPTRTLPANFWTRISHTFTAPVDAENIGWWVNATSAMGPPPSVGDTFDITALLVEQTDTVKDYFDGSTNEYNSDYIGGWFGAVDNSASGLYFKHAPVKYGSVSAVNSVSPNWTSILGDGVAATVSIYGSTGTTLSLAGIRAVVLPDGEEPPLYENFMSGAGHSGCDFKSAPSVVGYSAPQALDYQSLTAELIEVGAWQQ